MRNCLLCGFSSCPDYGIDQWCDGCGRFPPDPMDEYERRNFEEYNEEMMRQEAEEAANANAEA